MKIILIGLTVLIILFTIFVFKDFFIKKLKNRKYIKKCKEALKGLDREILL